MLIHLALFISVVANIVLGAILYGVSRKRALPQDEHINRPGLPEPSLAPPRPLHTFSENVAPGVEAGYWDHWAYEPDPEKEPLLALYFERGGEHVMGSATIRVPADHYLLIDGIIPPNVIKGSRFRSVYHPSKVAVKFGPKLQTATKSRTTLTGRKIELPQEEIDKIVAEHEYLARLFESQRQEEAQKEAEQP